jgi:hypothetical protein
MCASPVPAELEVWAHEPSVPLSRVEVAAGAQEVWYAGLARFPFAGTDGSAFTIVHDECADCAPGFYIWGYWDLGASLPIESVHVLSRSHQSNCFSWW